MEVGPMQNFVYLIGSKKKGEVAVVDPAWEVDRILEQASSMDVKVKYAFVTHTHFDHINGLSDLLDKTDAKVYVHKTETDNTQVAKSQIVPTVHGHELEMGDVKVRFLHTPGHTCGSQCFEITGNLVADIKVLSIHIHYIFFVLNLYVFSNTNILVNDGIFNDRSISNTRLTASSNTAL